MRCTDGLCICMAFGIGAWTGPLYAIEDLEPKDCLDIMKSQLQIKASPPICSTTLSAKWLQRCQPE